MTLSKTARFRVRSKDADAAVAAIEAFVEAVGRDEPETNLYAAFRRGQDPVAFMHLMVFADSAVEQRHRATGAVGRFTDVLYPLTVDGVSFDDWELIATTPSR